ncbi:restriction endonuclease subunit S [Rhodobacteraceae bacterium RKSG542]|uniref:restriction endonuclease subunit S n=1 Tax=Pseudovibrio flavus TaxID=2529854 RepID=UPI0012BBE38A|nr:restriction endonuclease subunit S [Pseudovibrio flavus]MTI17465.1 restriction endonuclease subunit S [Pseudovibrio flavus]
MVGKYRAYPEYKPSDVEWLGEVPSGWEVKRIKNTAELNPSKSELQSIAAHTDITFLPMEAIGETGSIDCSRIKPIREVINGYTYLGEGDVCLAKITPCFENGKAAIMRGLVNGIAFATTEVIPLRCRTTSTAEFLYYLITCSPFKEQAEGSMYGAGGQKRVADSFVANYHFAAPPLPEQRQIAKFLDHETAKIDRLIERQEKLIALLEEKRQAVISHAVTKGLNPGAPMRHSGIDWLGDIPAHWEVNKIKNICSKIIDCKNRTPDEVPNGAYYVVRTSSIRDGEFHKEGGYQTDYASFEEWTQRGVPKIGDILFTREAPTGEACLAPANLDFCLGQRTMALRPDSQIMTSKFLLYTIYGPLVRDQIEQKSKGSTVGHLRVGEVGNLPCLVPPIDEQQSILDHLTGMHSKFRKLTANALQAKVLLKERRTALISAAVTGKIDVRDWHAPDESESLAQEVA